jgi:hypothetical protein
MFDPTDPAPDVLCDDDECECPPAPSCDGPEGKTLSRELLMVFAGALASAAAPAVVKALQSLGRRIASALRAPPPPPETKPRKPRSPK